jgi:hypothetical protein
VEAVLVFFREELADVAFPDASLPVLETLVAELNARQQAVEELENACDEARRKLSQATTALTESAKRGLAYARIYAEPRPELKASMENLTLDAATTRGGAAKKTRKKRTPRVQDEPTALPLLEQRSA